MDESEIVLNRHVFVSIFGQEIEEMVPLKRPETSPLTISCVQRISKNHQQEEERVAESKIFPNQRVFVYIFGREIEEKVEKYSQSGYCSSTITYLIIIIYPQRKRISKTPAGGRPRG